jgi:predicted P-loop ATPase
MPDIKRGNAALEQVQGKMLIELAEIVPLIQHEMETLKAFLTNETDRFRMPWGRLAEDFPRTVTFIGTTNQTDYLKDETGARRFWPVKVGRVRLKELIRDRDQLFAEAVVRFKRKRPWWPSRRLEARVFVKEQAARQEVDEREAIIQAWIVDEAARMVGASTSLSVREIWENRDWKTRGFTVTEIWLRALGMRDDIPFTKVLQRQITNCLRRLGCTHDPTHTYRRYWLPPSGWKTGENGSALSGALSGALSSNRHIDNEDLPF